MGPIIIAIDVDVDILYFIFYSDRRQAGAGDGVAISPLSLASFVETNVHSDNVRHRGSLQGLPE